MGRPKVLVIDEDKSSIDLFGKALEPRGIDVFVQETPDKGIEKAIEVEPDLIFVNLIFRESNGLKVSKLIHEIEKLRNVPIVMLLAHKGDLDPKYTSTIGIVDVLVRPFTEQNIALRTLSVLGEQAPVAAPDMFTDTVAQSGAELVAESVADLDTESVPGWVDEEESFAGIAVEEDFQSLEGDARSTESVTAPGAEIAAAHVEDETEYDLDFTDEGDILIDQAIIDPGKGGKKMPERDDDKPEEDVIHLRRPEVPAPSDKYGGKVGDKSSDITPSDITNEEIDMEERNLFDESKDRKDAAIHKSFEEELDESATEASSEHDLSDHGDDYDKEEDFEEEKPRTGKKILLAIGGVVLIAGLALGAYMVKIVYFDDEKGKVAPPLQKEVVKETLPSSAEVKEPQKPGDTTATSGVRETLSDEKALPPAAVTAKNEITTPAVPQTPKSVPPAPAAAPAAKPESKSIEQKSIGNKSPESKSIEQGPAEKAAVKPAPQAAAKQPEKPKAEVPATPVKKDAGQAKTSGEKAPGKFAVQAGYFESGKNAEALVEKLKEKGHEAYIIKSEVSGKGKASRTFYRVLIGRFDTDKKAAAYAREIKQKDNISVVVHRN